MILLGLLASRHFPDQCQKHHNRHRTAWWCQVELAQVKWSTTSADA
jgi:hypothetical protein